MKIATTGRSFAQRIRKLIPLIVVFALVACSPEKPDEEQLLALVEEAESAAEKRELGPLRRLISDQYSDERGNNKKRLTGLVRFYLIGHQKIHLLKRISDIEITTDGQARMLVYVAMSGEPISGAQALINIRAKLMRFDVDLTKVSGNWKVKSLVWRQAHVDDFL